MVAYFRALVRALLFATTLAFAGQTADAARHNTEPTAAHTTTNAPVEHDDEFPFEGVLIIAGVVGVVILLAWIGSRIGDNSSHVIN